MHTVRQVARLAGITPRTLHHYDAVGLLPPTLVAANGYRFYDDAALVRLQQILFYRELGLKLEAIRRLMARKDFSVVEALEGHRAALGRRLERLKRLVETVDKTIAMQKGETTMSDSELFAGLSEQEKEYAKEAAMRWDPEVVKTSNQKYARLTAAEKQSLKDAGEVLNRDWAALIGTDPAGPAARAAVERWRKGIAFYYEPTPEILRGLAQMYNDDPRFKANYDKVDPRLAAYVRDCVEAVYGRNEAP